MTPYAKAMLAFGIVLTAATPALAQQTPRRVGQCVNTTIRSVETRLMDGVTRKPIARSGSAVSFTNGLYQVSYETIAAIEASRVGDPVRICLGWIPPNCPKGDNRGKLYATTNLRTGAIWKLPDSEHSCGGA